jgi:pyruvate/2-oxoglutarate dehydrogenase complex dihydrolipoamide acyltransferase (E2) component
MRKPIVTPDLGATPVLNLWLARPGDVVYAGDRVVEVLLGAATVDVSAPCSGRLAEKLAWPAEQLAAGQVLGYIETQDEEAVT